MRWMNSPIMVVDLETTGLDPEADRIEQIAIVRFEPGKKWKDMEAWVTLCGVDVQPSHEAILINKIDPADLAGKPKAEELMESIIDILEQGKIFLSYKAAFDFAFLRETHKRSGCKRALPSTGKNTIDPLIFARKLYDRARGWRLVQMAARLGIPIEKEHDALRDAMAAAEVMIRMAVLNDLPPDLSGLIALQDKYQQEWENRKQGGRKR